jgi:adenylate kinase family enzyme
MIKYKAWLDYITKIEIEKETEHFVYIGNRRDAKRSEFQSYYDRFEEAKQNLIDKYKRKLSYNLLEFKRLNGILNDIESLTEKSCKKE